MECSGDSQIESGAYRLADVELDVQAYQLKSSEMENSQQQDSPRERPDEDSPQARILALPSNELDGIWESYVARILLVAYHASG